MTRSGPWSVKGVDGDARDVAREAALREGLTIGTWVDRAIRARTGDRAINPTLENPASSLPDRNLDHPKFPAPVGFASDDAPEPIATAELPVAENTLIQGLSDDHLHLQKLTKADGSIDLFASTPRLEERDRTLPRPALAAIAVIFVGGLGVWAYVTIGPDGSTSSPNQVASASNPSDENTSTRNSAKAGKPNSEPA
jgi:hypothetical protein